MTDNAKAALNGLVEKITADRIATFVRGRLFSDGVSLPCHNWSLMNQFFVCLADTQDARGFRQWQEVGRNVKKGVHALYILVPLIKTKKKEGEEGTEEAKLTGFRAMPVFRMEDTEGAELDYMLRMKEFDPEQFPLSEVARHLGIDVHPVLTVDSGGYFDPRTDKIGMGSNNHRTFLHELSHAIDHRLPGFKDDKQFCEVTAELSSAFLGSLYGAKVELENTIAYIRDWSGKGHVAFRVMEAVGRVEQIYSFIENTRAAIQAA
jgi:antirestriction protein ArdC